MAFPVSIFLFLLSSLSTTILTPALAQNTTVTTTTTATQTITRVVDIFFLNQPAYEGLPYTMFHRDSGSVIAVDNVNNLTTYVITTTRVDRRPPPSATRTDNVTTAIPTLEPTRSRYWRPLNGTGEPSTITQGPATAMFTGTRHWPDHTVINRCSLNGTVEAACNLTHVGDVWYTKNPEWNGTYSTYSYNWTSGDRFGFAPVTITEGAELLTGPNPTPSGASDAAWGAVRGGPARAAVVVQASVLGLMLMVGMGFWGLGAGD
ncbi:hypothetical protein MFIFM68171_10730 [Madurella fahalii]|uniref:Uncharacterized protein n=1 Tax=Madurella fahalii TaxID=1157608 RepID=A0ABQ0GRZ7_9PEZI